MIALSVLGYLLGIVACYRAVADTYLVRETSARASLSYAAEHVATLWLTIVLVLGLRSLAGFLALFLPGIWLYIAWAVVYPVMLVEGTGGVAGAEALVPAGPDALVGDGRADGRVLHLGWL